MDRRFRTPLAAVLAFSVVGLAASSALAAPKDAAAEKLDKAAMDDDYLNVRFKEAEDKLRKALNECGASGCTPAVKARVNMHLGIILVNAGKSADATAAFVEGLKIDPNAAPEADFSSDEVKKAFEAAKAKVPGGTPAKPPPTEKPEPDEKPEPASDLAHEPVTEAPVNTPLPLYVGAEASAVKAILYYKPFGGTEWVKVEMKKMGKGFGAEIPCKDTAATGTLRYYIVEQDDGGDVIASAASKKQPYEVQVKNKISGEPPAFPGKDPPSQCKGKDVCPPGIDEPGCEPQLLGYGSKCTGPGQCNRSDGLACIEGTCQVGEEGEGGEGDGEKPKKNLLSIGFSVDDAIVSGGEVCSRENYESGTYACFRKDGKLYRPPTDGGDKGTVSGPPFAVGTMRVLIGYDRLLTNNIAAGVRLGYAFNGGPTVPNATEGDKEFFPYHAELRGTYWIGKNVMTKTGVRPYVFLGGGAAQVDAKISDVPVSDDCERQELCGPLAAGERRKKIPVDAYRKMGTSFVGGGGGIMYAINKSSGLTVDLKFSAFFGSPGLAISPTIGFMHGL